MKGSPFAMLRVASAASSLFIYRSVVTASRLLDFKICYAIQDKRQIPSIMASGIKMALFSFPFIGCVTSSSIATSSGCLAMVVTSLHSELPGNHGDVIGLPSDRCVVGNVVIVVVVSDDDDGALALRHHGDVVVTAGDDVTLVVKCDVIVVVDDVEKTR